MGPMNTNGMLVFTIGKSSHDTITACDKKVASIKVKIEERVLRVNKLREEYGITDAILIDLLQQARAANKRGEAKLSYMVQSQSYHGDGASGTLHETQIAAGVVNNLLTENDLIESERSTVKQLELISRNLKDLPDRTITSGVRPLRGHELSYEELEFLGL